MQKQTRRALIEYKIVKPFVDAAALGSACGSLAFATGGPAFNWSLLGGSASLFWYWGRSNLSRPKAKRATRAPGRHILVNSANGSRSMVFNQVAGGFITRETWGDPFFRWLRGKPRVRPQYPVIDKPKILEEFVFRSGQIELLESDVRLFLRAAWRNRHRGSGLSQRRWVRDCQKRPQWYQNLGPTWYYGLLSLLREAQQKTGRQLVVCTGPQWYQLAREPHDIFSALKWAESQK